MDLKGQIGSGGSYDVGVDAQLNVIMTAGYTDASTGISESSVTKIPLATILDKAAAASKNGTVVFVEGTLKQMIETYIASQPAS